MPNSSRVIGQIEIFGLSDRSQESDAQQVFPDIPQDAWTRFRETGLSAENLFTQNMGCYLLRTPDLTLLVDTGIGGELLAELESTGTRLEDVQAVAYTHLHGDHIAWNLSGPPDNLQPTFPNARYYVPRGDWSHFVERSSDGYRPRVHEKFQLLEERGLVHLVDNGFSISPELTVWDTPGHTPGHCSIIVQSGNDRAIIVGDALIHPIQVGHPEWNSRYDRDPTTATQSRMQLLEWMMQERALGGVSHFAAPGFGRVVHAADLYDWELA